MGQSLSLPVPRDLLNPYMPDAGPNQENLMFSCCGHTLHVYLPLFSVTTDQSPGLGPLTRVYKQAGWVTTRFQIFVARSKYRGTPFGCKAVALQRGTRPSIKGGLRRRGELMAT